MIVLLFLTGFCYVIIQNQRRNLRILIILALFFRFAATAFVNIFPVIPYTRDYSNYQAAMETIVTGWQQGVMFPVSPLGVVNSYSYLVSPVYAIAPIPATVELVNGLFGALIVFNIYRITASIFDYRRAMVTTLLVSFYPSFIHYTSILMRDALIILIISQILYLLVNWIVENEYPVVLVVLLPLLALLRPENVAFILPTVGVAVFVKMRPHLTDREMFAAATAIPISITIVMAITLLLFPEELPSLTPEALSAQRAWLARDTANIGGNYLTTVSFQSWLDVIVFAPVGAVYFLTVPLAWDIKIANPFMIIALIENIFVLYPAILALVHRLKYPSDLSRSEFVLLTTLVFGTVSYGLVEGNMGPAMRHRLQFTYIVFIIATPSFPLLTPFPVQSAEDSNVKSTESVD